MGCAMCKLQSSEWSSLMGLRASSARIDWHAFREAAAFQAVDSLIGRGGCLLQM
jgi:hypothetical protein